jgi:hypothetical protein
VVHPSGQSGTWRGAFQGRRIGLSADLLKAVTG